MSVVAWIRELIERLVAVPLLVVCGPLMIGLAIVIRSSYGGPVLVTRRMTTAGGACVEVFVFETWLPSGDKSAIGRFLDLHFLTELPALINVVRGEISFRDCERFLWRLSQ